MPGTNAILEFVGVTLWCSKGDERRERGRALQETNMYRFILRSLLTARNSSGSVYESFVLPGKCDKPAAPVLR